MERFYVSPLLQNLPYCSRMQAEPNSGMPLSYLYALASQSIAAPLLFLESFLVVSSAL